MPLLPARKNRLPVKQEAIYAIVSTAVLVVGALCFTFFVGTKLEQLSCRLGEPTDAQLLADVLQKLTLLGQRFNHPGSGSNVLTGDAEAPGVATSAPDFRGAHLGSAARASIPALDDRMKVTIPMQIWQTVRSYDRNSLATATLFNSWTNTNPQWDHFLFNAAEMHEFVNQHFEADIVQLFEAMPLDQMRVDVFRFMILVHHGGIFANLDTLCMWPAAAWVPRGCHFATAASSDPSSLSPALVAAVAGDDTIEAVLMLMLERMRGVKALLAGGAALADVAHNTTGAGAFTDAVLTHVGDLSGTRIKDVAGLLQARAGLQSKKVCVLTAAEMARYAVQAEVAWNWDRGLEWDGDTT